jgi:colicin import membrane protein
VVKPKPPEATKPTDAVKLPEKSKKAEPNPQPKPTIEPAKTTEKSIPPKKSDNKIEKNQEKKLTETTQKSEKPAPAPQKSETSSAANAKERKTEEREERTTEEREKQILAAMERVRAAEEAARREQGIAAAVDRVRQKVPDKGEGNPSNHETPRSARQNGETDGKRVDGGNPGGGYGAEFLAYTQHIKQRVKEAWIVTERKPGLSAVVRFGVDTTGEVLEVELAESSGDRAFDQTVLRAVRKANPLPPPPEAYREEFLTQKVEITFSGEERIK